MMPILANAALAVASSMALSILVKVTVTMALTLVSLRLARKSRAAVRHVLLTAVFAVLVALPVASILVPSASLVEVPISASHIAESPALPPPARLTPAVSHVSAVSDERAKVPSSRVPSSVLLLTGWGAGILLFLLPVLVGLWQVSTLRRSGRPWRRGQLLARQLAADTGICRRVEVLMHEGISGPASCGVVRATIVLPIDAQTWHEDDLRRAITHELEHVRRGDWVSQCLARVVCACYWFHPLVWITWRQLAVEAEKACDDAVLRRTEATAYADQLVVLAGRMSTAPNRPLLTMANRADLSARVVAVLDSRQRRGRAGTFCLALVCVASVLLVATISPLRVVTAQTPATSRKFAGLLVDQVGQPAPNVRLILSNVSTHRRIETQSNQTGHFTFSRVPAGNYLLQVREFGFVNLREKITLAAGQDLNRNIVLELGGVDDTTTVHSNEAPAVLTPPPPPLPPPSRSSQPYMSEAELDRCAQASMFCRVTPPHKIAGPRPIYPTEERESGVAGKVMVEGRIGKDGLIKDLRTLGPANPDFASATLDALRRWQFTATLLDGVPITVPIRVTAKFVVRQAPINRR